MSSYDKKQIIDVIQVVLVTAIVATFILVAGWMIGSASAHSSRISHELQLACIDKGGNVEYIGEDAKACVVR